MEPVAHPTPYSSSLRGACWDVPAGASVPSRGGWAGGGSLCVSSRSPTTEPMGQSRDIPQGTPREQSRSSVVELRGVAFLERKACLQGESLSEDV